MSKNSFNPTSPKRLFQEKGQSLIEMAFALIVLLFLLGGIIDLGRLFFTYIALRDAAQEGAVYASICPPDPAYPGNGLKIQAHVKASSHFPVNLNSPDITVVATFPEAAPGSLITVMVSQTNFRFLTPFVSAIFPVGTITAVAYDAALTYECP